MLTQGYLKFCSWSLVSRLWVGVDLIRYPRTVSWHLRFSGFRPDKHSLWWPLIPDLPYTIYIYIYMYTHTHNCCLNYVVVSGLVPANPDPDPKGINLWGRNTLLVLSKYMSIQVQLPLPPQRVIIFQTAIMWTSEQQTRWSLSRLFINFFFSLLMKVYMLTFCRVYVLMKISSLHSWLDQWTVSRKTTEFWVINICTDIYST